VAPSGDAPNGEVSTAPEPAAAETPEDAAGKRRSAFSVGWATAFVWALIAFAVTWLFAELVVFAVWLVGGRGGSIPTVARVGGLLFFWFHHVGLEFRLASGAFGGAVGSSGSITVALAPMLGTALAAGLLFVGGRRVGRAVGDGAAALHGAKVAVPYAVLCVVTSFATRLHGAELGGRIDSIHPSVLGAALWPLVVAAVFGVAGAISRRRGEPRGGLIGAVASGAWRMLWTGLALAFGGLLVLAVVRPGATGTYFDAAFRQGPARGATLLGVNALLVPNMATWTLSAAMGDCVAIETSSTGSGCFLSYGRLPSGRSLAASVGIGQGAAPPVGERRPPPAFWLFLVVPALASVAGGARAGRLVRGSTARTVGAGAAAGIVFAALMALTIAVATITVVAAGSIGLAGSAGTSGSIRAAIGPRLALGAGLAAAWGIGGGAIGAWFGGRSRASAGRPDGDGLPAGAGDSDQPAEDGEQRSE
jgi:hypothetical protein